MRCLSGQAGVSVPLPCHLFGRVTVTHQDHALPAWSLRPARSLPAINNTGLLRSLVGHHGQVSSVQWMANDTLATVGGDDGTLRVWDHDTGRTRLAVEVSEHLILRSRLSPDGRLLAQLVHEHPLANRGRPTTAPEWYLRTVVTDARDGSVIAVDHLPWTEMFLKGPADLHWSADSTLLAIAGGGRLRIWRPRTEPSTSPTQTHTVLVRALSWHPDAGLVGINPHRDLYIWADPTSPARPRRIELRLQYDEMAMRTVAWSPDGRLIAIGMDLAVVVLDAAMGQHVLSVYTDWACGTVSSLAWRPDGKLLAIAGSGGYRGGSAVAWFSPTPNHSTVLVDARDAAVTDLAWSVDGCVLAVASVDSTVRLFSKNTTNTSPYTRTGFFRQPRPPRGVKARSLPSGALVSGSTSLEDHDDHILIATSADSQLAVEANTSEKFAWVMSSTQACSDFGVLPHAARRVFGRPDERLRAVT